MPLSDIYKDHYISQDIPPSTVEIPLGLRPPRVFRPSDPCDPEVSIVEDWEGPRVARAEEGTESMTWFAKIVGLVVSSARADGGCCC